MSMVVMAEMFVTMAGSDIVGWVAAEKQDMAVGRGEGSRQVIIRYKRNFS